MEWQCEWGEFLPRIMSQHKEGDAMPDFVEKMPSIRSDLIWMVQAYSTLESSRQLGFSGAAPIPLSQIEVYIRMFGLIDDDIERFVRLIHAMDAVFVKSSAAKSKARSKSKHG